MLPTTRKTKVPYAFTGSGFATASGQHQQEEQDGSQQPSGSVEPTPTSGRARLLRDGLILFISLVLAVVFIIWGPAGDFIAGRAFTITTTNEVTYIFYNWTVTLPISTPSLNMQAWNNRLVGDVRFTPAPASDTHYTVNIETTAPGGMFKLTPWTMDQTQQSGFGIVVSDLLPNTYGIDYANIVVSLPSNKHYSQLIWNTYPPAASYASLQGRKWNVHFDNLTAAGIYFDKVRTYTDNGTIYSAGITSSQGDFQTTGGPNTILGEYTIPKDHLRFNTSGGEPVDD